MIFNLDKLDNTDNLEDGRPSNTLFTYYVTGSEDFVHFEPETPQYKKLKIGENYMKLRKPYEIENKHCR